MLGFLLALLGCGDDSKHAGPSMSPEIVRVTEGKALPFTRAEALSLDDVPVSAFDPAAPFTTAEASVKARLKGCDAPRHRAHAALCELVFDARSGDVSGALQGRPHGEETRPVSLVYRVRPAIGAPAKATVVLVPGKGEPFLRYADAIYDLRRQGLQVAVMDARGTGFSSRLVLSEPWFGEARDPRPTEEDYEKAHVDDFENYRADFDAFLAEVVLPGAEGPIFAVSHSMGGAIVTAHLIAAGDASPLAGAVLAAPCYDVSSMREQALLIDWLAFRDDAFTPGERAFEPVPFELHSTHPDVNTSEPRRYDYYVQMQSLFPELRVAGVTYRWAKAINDGMASVRRGAHRVRRPVLMFQGGGDHLVDIEAQSPVCARIERGASSCRLIRYPGAEHEVLQEADAIRDDAFQRILSFIDGLLQDTGASPSSASSDPVQD